MRPIAPWATFPLALAFACGGDDSSSPPDAGPDPYDFYAAPKSCAYTCPSASCAESTSGYSCQNLGEWTKVPHDATCPKWDGKTYDATPSKCTVSAAAGDAVKLAGADPDDPATSILPDGRRVKPSGTEWLFDEADLAPGFPVRALPVPGSSLVLVVDVGYGSHSVRLLDAAKMGSMTSPVVASVKFDAPETLWQGVAYVAPDLVLVATNDGVVQALKLDVTNKALVRDDARSIALPSSIDDTNMKANYFVSGLAVSPDGKTLVVASVFDTRVLAYDLSAGSYGKALGQADLGLAGTFDVAFDPNDPTGRYAYVSRLAERSVAEIDLGNRAAPVVSRTFDTGKDPQGMAFLDARYLAVASTFGDAITIVDRASGATVLSVAPDATSMLHAHEPTVLAMDPKNHRLYATLAGRNAIGAWDVDTSVNPPKISPAGKLATSWWPTSVAVDDAGGVHWTTGRGRSNGPLDSQVPAGNGDSMHGVRGAYGLFASPQPTDLAAGDVAVEKNDDVSKLAGAPAVTCPGGENDFALPPTNTMGPSPKIKHVVFIVRENKTFDGVFGDLPHLRGDPTLTMKKSTADMDKLWLNARDVARTFATSDNYYTGAELSIQGHFWTTYGRSSDFMERTWPETGYSRNAWRSAVQPQAVDDYGRPEEGSLFDWLGKHGVPYQILGEASGLPDASSGPPSIDSRYPGGFIQSIGYPDVEKACYFAGRLRVLCDIPTFVYMTLPNDHTLGVGNTTPSPETMVAVNDEATGMVIEAFAASPFWADSLVVVTEDDPADGGDHVDHHRVPVLFASPWIKRGYVSPTHIDTSSLHKMFAHLLGLPYPSETVAKAALPLDLFSSTPYTTPFVHAPRQWPLSCGEKSTLSEKRLTGSWNLEDVDEQPGLDQQIRRTMRGEELETLPPELESQIARSARGASRVNVWRR